MPDELREFIERRTKENHMATPTEYIRSLIREDKKRAEQESLERLILDGIQSGDAIAVPDLDRYFAKKKQALLERLKSKAGRK
jgi:antitoxin ParD1/3/4